MPTSFNTANCVPRDRMRNALCDLQVAVRANPCFVVIGIGSRAGLHRVFDIAFDFRTHPTKTNSIQVERHMLCGPLIWPPTRFWCATH